MCTLQHSPSSRWCYLPQTVCFSSNCLPVQKKSMKKCCSSISFNVLFVGILNIIIHYWYCFLSTGIPDDLCTEAHRHTHKLTHTVIRTQWHTHTITHMHTVTHTHTQSTNVFLQSARPGQSTTVPEISRCQSDFPANSSESVQCLWWSANSETVSRISKQFWVRSMPLMICQQWNSF